MIITTIITITIATVTTITTVIIITTTLTTSVILITKTKIKLSSRFSTVMYP
jgi:hypothetical protein